MANFKLSLFQTNASNAASGGGQLTLTGTDGDYHGRADLNIEGEGEVSGAIAGSEVPNQGDLTIIDLASPDGNVKLTLVKNPYESRVSYGGGAAINGGFIFNITAVSET